MSTPSTALPQIYRVNPLLIWYAGAKYPLPAGSLATCALITGRTNRYDDFYQEARKRGAELYAYIDPMEVPNTFEDTNFELGFYGSNGIAIVQYWPFPTYGARGNYIDPVTNVLTKMADIRVGSPWSNSVVAYIENLMREGKVDGVFLDVIGGKLWSKAAAWSTWPLWEQAAWTAGCIDLVRRLDDLRRKINPRFKIVNNNIWDNQVDQSGFAGEQYINGFCMEHAEFNAYHINMANRPVGGPGIERRMFVIARSTQDAISYSKVCGPTHISDQSTANYHGGTAPAVPFNRLDYSLAA